MCDNLGEAEGGVQSPGTHGSAVLCRVAGSNPWQLMEFVFMETKRWTKLLSPAAQSSCDDLASQPSPQNEGKPPFLSLARAGDRQTDDRHLIPTPYPPQQDPTNQCLNPHPSEVQGPPEGSLSLSLHTSVDGELSPTPQAAPFQNVLKFIIKYSRHLKYLRNP